MTKAHERAAKARSLPINRRPGEVVCICEKNGNASLFDPSAWIRTMTIHYRKANEGRETEDDAV